MIHFPVTRIILDRSRSQTKSKRRISNDNEDSEADSQLMFSASGADYADSKASGESREKGKVILQKRYHC